MDYTKRMSATDVANKVLNTTLKFALTKTIGAIPVVGSLLSSIAGAFWPGPSAPTQLTPDEMFKAMKDRIEGLIDSKISDNNLKVMRALLSGLGDVVAEFQRRGSTPEFQAEYFSGATSTVLNDIKQFEVEGMEVNSLPILTSAYTAWLGVLREAILLADTWNYSEAEKASLQTLLEEQIAAACNYVDVWYAKGVALRHDEVKDKKMVGAKAFNHVHDFIREYTQLVLDYRQAWPYFDVKNAKHLADLQYTRTLYAPAQGQTFAGEIKLPNPSTGPIHKVTMCTWEGGSERNFNSKIRAYGIKQLQLDYATGDGPGGADTTGLMGLNYTGTPIKKAYTGLDIRKVITYVGEITDGMEVEGFYDGKPYGPVGLKPDYGNSRVVNEMDGHIVSCIHMGGSAWWNGTYYPTWMVVEFYPLDDFETDEGH